MKKSQSILVAFAASFVAGVPMHHAGAGAPSFTDANWVSMGVASGIDGGALAAAMDAAGNVYIGGSFNKVVGLAVSNLAKWDGTNWSALGAGVNGQVSALQISGTNLYVGGSFTTAGGIVASNLARWDGTAWSALGSGTDDDVVALAVSGSDLYVLGAFITTGGGIAYNLAKWNGNTWSALGSFIADGGFSGWVSALAVSGSDVYVGGSFSDVNGVSANYIAKWNPSTGWTALGSGIEPGGPGTSVNALLVSGGVLYAGGEFLEAGGVTVNCVARWNGSAWSALGSGLKGSGGYYPVVWSLAISGGTLYAGGSFARPGETIGDGIAKWNGSSWSALGSGLGLYPGVDPGARVAASGSNVYAFGGFSNAGGVVADGMAKWNGNAWYPLVPPGTPPPSSVSGPVFTMAVSGTNLYVGGAFGTAGSAVAPCLARWNGSSWSPLGAGPDAPWGLVLAVSDTNLYTGMWFTPATGPGIYLTKWNGSSWTALGGFADSEFTALAVSGTDIYAGGYFATVDGGTVASRGVAKWNGLNWSALGSGLDGYASALAMSGTNLYVGGGFTTAGGIPAANVARWDGYNWSPLGSGLIGQGAVAALVVWNGDLYAGGSFTNAGGFPANYIARWNGTNWSSLGTGLGGVAYPRVSALTAWGSNLFVGGRFETAGGVPALNLARWDGSTWSRLGSGVTLSSDYQTVNSLAVVGSELYVGGSFASAGGKPSPYITRAYLVAPPGGIVDSITASPGTPTLKCYGNPGHQFDVQRALSLAPPVVWTTVSPSPLSPDTNGVFTFADTTATNGAAYYRSRER